MEKDILVILMIAFGLFAILMFILFYVYAKKYYNDKHMDEDYESEQEEVEKNKNEEKEINTKESDEEFVPKKKK